MLRVGLTGDLGSGKSTVAARLQELGAIVLSSDEMGRAMMQPGEAVYAEIVQRFGPSVVGADKHLNRKELARLAFNEQAPRVDELNAIVHPAVIAAQAQAIAAIAVTQPRAVVVVESALLFITTHAGNEPWRARFDCVVLVTASDETKVVRFVERAAGERALSEAEREALREDAERRLKLQLPNAAHEAECIVIRNDAGIAELAARVDEVWAELVRLESFS